MLALLFVFGEAEYWKREIRWYNRIVLGYERVTMILYYTEDIYMKLINNNLKKAGYVNAVLIIAAIVLRVINIGKMSGIAIVDALVCAIGLLSGLIYSLNGYKKDAAKYYKVFMLLYAVDSLISFVAILSLYGISFSSANQINLIHAIHLVILVCTCLLAFAKDFGKSNSKTAAWVILILTGIKLINDITTGAIVSVDFASLAIFIQAIIAFVLVSHKYADKEARGAK